MTRILPLGSSCLLVLLCSVPASADGPRFDLEEIHLSVALVQDPDFPPLSKELVTASLNLASEEFAKRFDVPKPRFEVVNEYTVTGFLGAYALPVDPKCQPLYAARYRGGKEKDLNRNKTRALAFLERWKLKSLKGFIEPEEQKEIKSHEDIYQYYVKKYVKTVEAMKNLKTPSGTPLVDPGRSASRSFVAWTCALLRQEDYDVVLTNTFILADLTTEPHPHAVFGKAKIGGIAARSPARKPLRGQALLATTFGIDTKLPQFMELKGKPATFEERAKILGAYLLAHEVAHAIFGIPDVFDHPKGCLMTSRPGATYRDGLKELEAHPEPCPKCRPYVRARAFFDKGRRLQREGKHKAATRYLMRSAKKMPKHFHGGRKKRMSEILVLASQASADLGKKKLAKRYAKLALKLSPRSKSASMNLAQLTQSASMRMSIPVSRTTTTATTGPSANPVGQRKIELK